MVRLKLLMTKILIVWGKKETPTQEGITLDSASLAEQKRYLQRGDDYMVGRG